MLFVDLKKKFPAFLTEKFQTQALGISKISKQLEILTNEKKSK